MSNFDDFAEFPKPDYVPARFWLELAVEIATLWPDHATCITQIGVDGETTTLKVHPGIRRSVRWYLLGFNHGFLAGCNHQADLIKETQHNG